MKIESLKVTNFKAFRNVEMKDIPNFCVIVGANGTGKSTLFKIFGFLKETMDSNVNTALVKLGGSLGFDEVRSRDTEGDIEIEIKFRAKAEKPGKNNPLITYELHIAKEGQQAVVSQEVLKYRRGERGRPWEFLNFKKGEGFAVTNEGIEGIEERDLHRENHKLKSPDILAIKGLAQFEKFPAVVSLGKLIEEWHLSDIHIGEVRKEQEAGHAERLSQEGDNLSLVIDYLHKTHPKILAKIIGKMKNRIPGVVEVTTKTIETGQVLLRVKDQSFNEPFLVRYVSDGTIKMLAYLVLLNAPNSPSLLCVEEPENQLYLKLLEELAEEFQEYAREGKQVFLSTHSPDLLNAVKLEEVFWLVKKDGYTSIVRAKENEEISNQVEQGENMGWLWKEGLFDGVDPS